MGVFYKEVSPCHMKNRDPWKAVGDNLEQENISGMDENECGKDEAKQKSESLSVPAVEMETEKKEVVPKVKRGGRKTEQKAPVKISSNLFGGGRKRSRRPEKTSSEPIADQCSLPNGSPSEVTEGSAVDPGGVTKQPDDIQPVKKAAAQLEPPRPGP